jgi:hypothetical protein
MQRELTGRKLWPCVNNDGQIDPSSPCETNLGFVVGGELVIEMSSVAAINTEGCNVVLTCANCGRPKRWFSKKSAVQAAFYKYQERDVADLIESRKENGETD